MSFIKSIDSIKNKYFEKNIGLFYGAENDNLPNRAR